MPKRKAKRSVQNPPAKRRKGSDCDDINAENPVYEKEMLTAFSDREVEHRIAATQAIRDVEIQHLLIVLRLLRSNFNEEQMKTPVLQFLKEHMPCLTVKLSVNDGGGFELEWKDKGGNNNSSSSCDATDQRSMHASLLQRMQMECSDLGVMSTTTDGFEFAVKKKKKKKKNLLGAVDLHIPNTAVEVPVPPKTQMPGLKDAFGMPEVITQDLSAGLINKVQRPPKAGELLQSVHGSPLGVYKEDNMEVIHEYEEELRG